MRLRFKSAFAYALILVAAGRASAADEPARPEPVEGAPSAPAAGADLTSGVLPGSCAQVKTVFEAAGQLKFRAGDAVKDLTTQVSATFTYDEKQLPGQAGLLAARHYRTAQAKILI